MEPLDPDHRLLFTYIGILVFAVGLAIALGIQQLTWQVRQLRRELRENSSLENPTKKQERETQ